MTTLEKAIREAAQEIRTDGKHLWNTELIAETIRKHIEPVVARMEMDNENRVNRLIQNTADGHTRVISEIIHNAEAENARLREACELLYDEMLGDWKPGGTDGMRAWEAILNKKGGEA